ncbi:hypothetical protein ACO0LO_22315 [Undibacterium sp. TJN25]|uniref:hypothetical protein n=1 Tax=Undibacterium sp. TJN25 TaxID=3413056 RepID=UPI003BF0C3A7
MKLRTNKGQHLWSIFLIMGVVVEVAAVLLIIKVDPTMVHVTANVELLNQDKAASPGICGKQTEWFICAP